MNCLKNNRGFSLLEVLIGVTIVGIISAIAIPQFANYRDSAALTAAATTGKNLAKAYNLCKATKTTCTTLTNLNIACETCGTIVDGSDDFCVNMKQKISGKEFRSCVGVDKGNGDITQRYGGEFKFCYQECKTTTPSNCAAIGDKVVIGSVPSRCDDSDDCTLSSSTNYQNKSCEKNSSTSAGTCAASTGVCQST